jgi:hypothetical protein
MVKKAVFDFFTSWITTMFSGILSEADTITSIVTQTPVQVFGQDFWDSLLKIGTSAVMPFAILILSFCMAFDMYKVYCRSNGAPDMELISFTFIKYIIPFFCVTYTYDILQFIFDKVNGMVLTLYQQVTMGTGNSIDTNAWLQEISQMNWWSKLGLTLQLIGPWFGTQILVVISTVIVYGRLFEIVMYWIFAPIPFATFVNDDLRHSIGINFIKMFAALILQGGFIVLSVALYLMLVKSVTIQTTVSGVFAMLGYSSVLVVVMAKTGSMSKRLLGTF